METCAGDSSNTVPESKQQAPPNTVVPKRLPLLSMISPAMGFEPVEVVERRQCANGTTTYGQLKNDAVVVSASKSACTQKITAAVHDQPSPGNGPIGAVERR